MEEENPRWYDLPDDSFTTRETSRAVSSPSEERYAQETRFNASHSNLKMMRIARYESKRESRSRSLSSLETWGRFFFSFQDESRSVPPRARKMGSFPRLPISMNSSNDRITTATDGRTAEITRTGLDSITRRPLCKGKIRWRRPRSRANIGRPCSARSPRE